MTADLLSIPEEIGMGVVNKCAHDLRRIKDATTPIQKLEIFSTITSNLVLVYKNCMKKNPSQDELFPLMVYVVLQGNPDNLLSHIEYI